MCHERARTQDSIVLSCSSSTRARALLFSSISHEPEYSVETCSRGVAARALSIDLASRCGFSIKPTFNQKMRTARNALQKTCVFICTKSSLLASERGLAFSPHALWVINIIIIFVASSWCSLATLLSCLTFLDALHPWGKACLQATGFTRAAIIQRLSSGETLTWPPENKSPSV